jgi:hypothetical protein
MNNPPDHPTLLLVPPWYGGPPDETKLPLPAAAYEIRHQGDRSTVTVIATGEVVFNGIGPAEVVVSRAPF